MSTKEGSPEKPLIHLKMKVGTIEFEIECREDQVQQVVEKVLSSVTEYASKPLAPPEPVQAPVRAETCRGIIERLLREGWFAEPRALADVHSEMARNGFHFDRTAVAHSLADMVREGTLTREGKARRYFYTQKRPPNPQQP
jgi:hypothetical protein